METQNRQTSGMKIQRIAKYHGYDIIIWRGKYNRKSDRLYAIGNIQFDTFDEAKSRVDQWNSADRGEMAMLRSGGSIA